MRVCDVCACVCVCVRGGVHVPRPEEDSGIPFCHCYSTLFPVGMTNILGQKQLRKKGLILAHSSRWQSVTAGKSQCQELEGAGHRTAIIRKREQWLHGCLLPAVFLPRAVRHSLPREWSLPRQTGLSSNQDNPLQTCSQAKLLQRIPSQVTLHCTNMIIKTNHRDSLLYSHETGSPTEKAPSTFLFWASTAPEPGLQMLWPYLLFIRVSGIWACLNVCATSTLAHYFPCQLEWTRAY